MGSDPIKFDPIKFSPEESLALDQNSSYFNRIENKKAFPSMQVFFQICDYLDITPSAFLSGGINMSDKMQEIIPILERLTPRQMEMIKEPAELKNSSKVKIQKCRLTRGKMYIQIKYGSRTGWIKAATSSAGKLFSNSTYAG